MSAKTGVAVKPMQIDVSILGRDYKVACKEDERAELMQAVALLDARMREIRDAGKVAAVDRIAVDRLAVVIAGHRDSSWWGHATSLLIRGQMYRFGFIRVDPSLFGVLGVSVSL